VTVPIPQSAIPVLPAGFLDGTHPGAPVVDTGNYYSGERDGLIAAIEAACREACR
jgi:8-hydroxy-5-deazaflavin:NADPH oxidoreductase